MLSVSPRTGPNLVDEVPCLVEDFVYGVIRTVAAAYVRQEGLVWRLVSYRFTLIRAKRIHLIFHQLCQCQAQCRSSLVEERRHL